MISPFRRRQAQAEVERRRKERETYTVPITAKPGRATADDDAAVMEYTADDVKDVQAFLKEFYNQIYSKAYQKGVLDKLLAEYPDDLGAFYKSLVPSVVSEEVFWQGYLFRCNVDRVLTEWERRPKSGQQARAAALKSGGGGGDKNSKRTKGEPPIPTNRRADALRTTSSGGKKEKNENIPSPPSSDTAVSVSSTSSSSSSSSSSLDRDAPPNVTLQKRLVDNDNNNKAETKQPAMQQRFDLRNIALGLLLALFAADYVRRLGFGHFVCDSTADWVQHFPWMARPWRAICNDDRGAVAVVIENRGKAADAPRANRFARFGMDKNNNQQQQMGGGYDDNPSDLAAAQQGHNPLWNSWRNIAEETVDEEVQQGQYGGNGNGNGIEVRGGQGSEGIVGYFKDKFGRAGVVVEQHVVHHHVHHVIHEHR